MGYLQPDDAASIEPVSLWHFAKRIAGRECSAYVMWFDATAKRMRAIDHDRVAASVSRRWPGLLDPELFIRENEARERRAKRLRSWAAHLLATVIPSKVRREFVKDSFLISGRNGAGERVSLTLDDLAGLNIDLTSNSLIGPTTAYTDVSIRPAKSHPQSVSANGVEEGEGELQPTPPPNRRPGPKPLGEEPLTTLIGEVAKRVLSQSSIEKGARPFLDKWENKQSGN